MVNELVENLRKVGDGINGIAGLIELVMKVIAGVKNGGNDEQNQDVEGCC